MTWQDEPETGTKKIFSGFSQATAQGLQENLVDEVMNTVHGLSYVWIVVENLELIKVFPTTAQLVLVVLKAVGMNQMVIGTFLLRGGRNDTTRGV
jgi:hypothetical protein